MTAIADARLRPIYDSRGRPTVEATVVLTSGARGVAGAPSGASTGRHEARAFPDGGAEESVRRFREWARPALIGLEGDDQAAVDAALHAADGTPDFGRLGGNAATATSVATALARANELGQPLWERLRRPGADPRSSPTIVGNCINGGRHAIGGPDIQEFHAIAPGPDAASAIAAAIAVHAAIGTKLTARFPSAALGRGDEGGWVAPIGNVEAVELLAEACAEVRDRTHAEVHPGLDLAASEFFDDGRYRYREQSVDTDGQVAFVADLVDRYGLRYLEDPLEEESFDGFAALTRAVGAKTLVVGDDLYTTDVRRVKDGAERRATNAVLVKVNQVGTLTDAFATVDFARAHGLANVVSHRSGEVPDTWLTHVAVGAAATGLKCGLLGGERVGKLNELLRLGAPPEPSR
ncbi:MAG TPA: enolase C-terminal domain-like protein [Thermoplasmata archaeon]|nr:enolase C-terminal domain-like protein [Thermoplasmata archaeon]